jgi:hypothetical protein
MIEDISYREYRKKSDIHGAALYPAVMVAPVQKAILEQIMNEEDIKCIFDPFHGSGTALYEALEISGDINLIGCDINPLANLITKVKLQGVNQYIEEDIKRLKEYIYEDKACEVHSFHNIKKWFRQDVIESLSRIRRAVIEIKDKQNRLYFWCMLCDIVRRYSNTRSSTYKLHIKEPDAINKMKNNVIEDYIRSVQENVNKFYRRADNFRLFKCDILEQIKKFKDKEFDITITSPPYGDNATTVTYGQFSILALMWIDRNDLELEGWEFDNFSKIDTYSLGGRKKELILDSYEESLIAPYLNKIELKKQEKVKRFFNDYFSFIKEVCRVTDLYIVMTLGNRTVDGININLTEITQNMLDYYGFKKNQFIEREIPSKRMPKKTSRVNNKPVNSMNYEYLIIYKR